MRNFDYLKELELNDLHRFCAAAEEHQVCNPDFSAVNARRALEYIVRSLYQMKNLNISERTSLFEMVDGEPFKEFIGDEKVMMAVHYVRKVGNLGAHAATVSKKESSIQQKKLRQLLKSTMLNLKSTTRRVIFSISSLKNLLKTILFSQHSLWTTQSKFLHLQRKSLKTLTMLKDSNSL